MHQSGCDLHSCPARRTVCKIIYCSGWWRTWSHSEACHGEGDLWPFKKINLWLSAVQRQKLSWGYIYWTAHLPVQYWWCASRFLSLFDGHRTLSNIDHSVKLWIPYFTVFFSLLSDVWQCRSIQIHYVRTRISYKLHYCHPHMDAMCSILIHPCCLSFRTHTFRPVDLVFSTLSLPQSFYDLKKRKIQTHCFRQICIVRWIFSLFKKF